MADAAERKPHTRSWWFFLGGAGLAVLLVAAGVLWLVVARSTASGRLRGPTPPDTGDATTWGQWEGSAVAAANRRVVELALYDPVASTWTMEKQTIDLPDQQSGRLAAVVDLWLAAAARPGPGSMVPRESALLDAFVVDRRVYLNLSQEFAGSAGITAELERVVGLTKTLRANFPGITELQILIAGSAVHSLSGQLAVSAPLRVAYFAGMGE